MSYEDIQAVIASARARGVEPLERFVRKRLPEATQAEVREAVELAVEIVDTVPVLFASARQEAEDRGLTSVAGPLLAHAESYFLDPIDLIPEMTQGLVGLLDDSYLVLRILQNLQRGPTPLLEFDLDEPLRFLKRLIGSDVSDQLDMMSIRAMQEISDALSDLWREMAHNA